jgi:hypothetical protein
MQQSVLLSPKFGEKSSHIFSQSPWNVTAVCGIGCLEEFFVNHPIDVKENYEHALEFPLHFSRLFPNLASLDLPFTAQAFFPGRLSNHSQGLRPTSSEICTKFGVIPLSGPSGNRIRQDTRLQIKGHKNQHFHPVA